MNPATYRGKILYLTDGKGEEGREFFTVTVQPNGDRTLRAQCEMDNDELLRDVVLSLDSAWRPLDAFVRLTIHNAFQGSAWFRFSETLVECETFTRDAGRLSQRQPITSWPPSFGGHPVCCDTWHSKAAALRRTGNATMQAVEGIAMSSPLPNGGSGPMLTMADVDVEFCGTETITTPAGTFDTIHVKNYSRRRGRDHPVEIWAWGDDFVPVRARWDLLGQTYELVELEHPNL
ncbi:MAG: DUF3108 domain-containing protein [Proteobacteria bacterium]|nr:DUF3108 domain-containing protein [Pseudomonadota bacterium]MDA1057732.1 DUF3108 domain-containing protein [Pseudomonadota bacterium]